MYPRWQVGIIKNEKGRLGQEEIDRMVREAEQFASEDKAQRKKIEALNSLSSFVYGLKSQVGDQEGLGGGMNIFLLLRSHTRQAQQSAPRPVAGYLPYLGAFICMDTVLSS